MSDPLSNFLRRTMVSTRQGRVVTADQNSAVVQIGERTVILRRTNALALKPGDRVNVSGDQIVGKRRPPPTGSTYQV